MNRIYMDANATTPLAPEVFEAMRPCLLERFGNASSIHYQGRRTHSAVEQSRGQVAALLHCDRSEVVFTSGGTEGDNLALFGLVRPGDHLITSSIEHHAVLHAAEHLQKRGIAVTFVPVGADCIVDPGEVLRALRPNTRLISVMMANNETGTIQPLEEIGCIAAEADVYFHTDAVQAAGKLAIDVEQIRCDLLTIAAHKMYGPQGVGALYVRHGTPLEPLFFGGAHERQRRAGTENVAGIVGLGKAAELALKSVVDLDFASLMSSLSHIAALRDRLENGIVQRVENSGVNGGSSPRVPNTTNLWFDDLDGEALFIALDLKGLSVSGGSACASGAAEPSHVLTAMGLSKDRAKASLRFSLTRYSTQEEVDAAVEIVSAAAERLREVSPTARSAVSAIAV
jgi:cysteine desulfurase